MPEDWCGSAWPRRSGTRGPSPASAARLSLSPRRKSNTSSFWLLKHSHKLLYFECFTVLVLPLQKCTVKEWGKKKPKDFSPYWGFAFSKDSKTPWNVSKTWKLKCMQRNALSLPGYISVLFLSSHSLILFFVFPLTMFTYPQNVNLSKFDISSKDFFNKCRIACCT